MQNLKADHQNSNKVSAHRFYVPVYRVNKFDWLQGCDLLIFGVVGYRKLLTHSMQVLTGSGCYVSECLSSG